MALKKKEKKPRLLSLSAGWNQAQERNWVDFIKKKTIFSAASSHYVFK